MVSTRWWSGTHCSQSLSWSSPLPFMPLMWWSCVHIRAFESQPISRETSSWSHDHPVADGLNPGMGYHMPRHLCHFLRHNGNKGGWRCGHLSWIEKEFQVQGTSWEAPCGPSSNIRHWMFWPRSQVFFTKLGRHIYDSSHRWSTRLIVHTWISTFWLSCKEAMLPQR